MDHVQEFKRKEMADPESKFGRIYRVQEVMLRGGSVEELSEEDKRYLESLRSLLK